MEGAVFPVGVVLVCEPENKKSNEAVRVLQNSGFEVKILDVRRSDYDGPRLYNGRHNRIGYEAILDFAHRFKPNYFG